MLTVIFVLYMTLIVIFIAVFSWDTNFLLFRKHHSIIVTTVTHLASSLQSCPL